MNTYPKPNHSSENCILTARRTRFASLCISGLCLFALLPWTALKAESDGRPSDTEITAAVDGEFIYDSVVPFNEIDVMTAAGIVTLSGECKTLLAKERAEAIAESTRGVRSVVNLVTVKPVVRDNEEIRRDVKEGLLNDAATESYEVQVEVDNGTVTLAGTVDSWQEKELVSSVTKGIKGVAGVQNNLLVAYETERLDTEIQRDVEAVLARDIWVDDLLVDADVSDGVVTLSGTVGSVAEKRRAFSDAWVTGVVSVDDEKLSVEPWAKDEMRKERKAPVKTDGSIEVAVKDSLLYDPRVLSFNPEIEVTNGVVTLTGVVNNLKAKRAAEQDARNTVGVWRVKNHLKIRSEVQPDDSTITANIRKAFIRDPYLDRYEIGVSSIDGMVYLDGTVDSYFEKGHAEDLASVIKGVTGVNNNITVSFPQITHYDLPFDMYYAMSYHRIPLDPEAWPFASDGELKDRIEDELFWSPFVDSDEVDVTVSNGIATLRGAVDDGVSEYNAAEENAWEAGPRNVINKLVIE